MLKLRTRETEYLGNNSKLKRTKPVVYQSDNIPDQSQIDELLPTIGWDKVIWDKPQLKLIQDMEIDLGGIGKEYAVDRCALLVRELSRAGVLINLGGELPEDIELAYDGLKIDI